MTHRLFLQDTSVKQASEESDLLMQYSYEEVSSTIAPAYNVDTEFYCATCDYWHPFEEGCQYEYVVNGVKYCRSCYLPEDECICYLSSAVCGECFQNPGVCHTSPVQTCDLCHKELSSCICPKQCSKCGKLGCTGTCDACSKCGIVGCDGNCDQEKSNPTSEEIAKDLEEHKPYAKVLKDSVVLGQMSNAWSIMLKETTAQKRREVGGWIYYNVIDHEYCMGNLRYGTWVTDPTEHGSIDMSQPGCSQNGVKKGSVAIGFFHTHTSLADEAEGTSTKIVGPSSADFSSVKEGEVGYVIDYIGIKNPEDGKYFLKSGHKQDDSKAIYVFDKTGVKQVQPF